MADTDTIEVPLDDAPQPELDRSNMRLDQPPPAAAEPEITVADAPEPPPKPKRKPVAPDEGVQALKAQLDAERAAKADADRARAAAEQRAAAAEQTAVSAQKEAGDTRLHLISTSILSVTQTLDAAESAYAAAIATGDHAQAAKLSRQMATEGARLAQLEATKQHLESAPAPRPPQRPASRVDEIASKMAPESAAWIRAHPDYAEGDKYDEMVAAHNMALARRLTPNTPAYFQFIERKLDLADAPEPSVTVDTAPQRATGGRTTAAPAAPVSRSGTGMGGSSNSIRLSQKDYNDAVEGAKISGISLQEYLRQKAAIDRENLH